MASTAHSIPAPAQQPGLRSFIVYDHLPTGMVAYAVADNRNEPHLSTGDFVIVDPEDREPHHGDLFVIQWKSGGGPTVMVTNFMDRFSCWAVGGTKPIFVVEREGVGLIQAAHMGDFGYRADYLREVICGRVVGILEASFTEPALDFSGA